MKNPFKGGVEEIKRIINAYFNLIRIRSIKRGAEISSRVTFGLLTIIFILLGSTFFCIALALFIGELMNSYALGFLTVGAVPILAMLLMLIFKEQTYRRLLNFFTKIMTKK